MASGDQDLALKGTDMEEKGASKEPQLTSAVEPQDLPGYLSWEQDLEMVSKFLDRKVSPAHPTRGDILTLFSLSIGRAD